MIWLKKFEKNRHENWQITETRKFPSSIFFCFSKFFKFSRNFAKILKNIQNDSWWYRNFTKALQFLSIGREILYSVPYPRSINREILQVLRKYCFEREPNEPVNPSLTIKTYVPLGHTHNKPFDQCWTLHWINCLLEYFILLKFKFKVLCRLRSAFHVAVQSKHKGSDRTIFFYPIKEQFHFSLFIIEMLRYLKADLPTYKGGRVRIKWVWMTRMVARHLSISFGNPGHVSKSYTCIAKMFHKKHIGIPKRKERTIISLVIFVSGVS